MDCYKRLYKIKGNQIRENVTGSVIHSKKDEQLNNWYKEAFTKEMGCSYIVVNYLENDPESNLQRFIKTYNQLK
ncbi:hypothetical protein CN488_14875 [Bacillus anthracis]|nr:hypothetical protein CN488_14875 [Bacillus anthracis]PGR19582.1 hypothetical protein COC50_22255 [Bacillus anthracis]